MQRNLKSDFIIEFSDVENVRIIPLLKQEKALFMAIENTSLRHERVKLSIRS